MSVKWHPAHAGRAAFGRAAFGRAAFGRTAIGRTAIGRAALGRATLGIAALCLALTGRAAEKLDIVIDGIDGEYRANVEAAMSLVRRRADPDLSADTIRDLHRRSEQEIRRALEPYGFYRPAIDSRLLPPAPGGHTWRASYRIDRGPAVPLAAVEIHFQGPGSGDGSLAALAAEFPLRAAASLDHRQYEAGKRELLSELRERGYLDAAYSLSRVEVDLATYRARVELAVDTGPRYRVGEISLEETPFSAAYLAHYLILEAGEPFSRRRLAEQRTSLSRSGHFERVTVTPGEPTGEASPRIPLHIGLTPFKANRYRGRLGWGTDTGLGAELDWTRRYLGRRGHRFNLGVTAVEERNRLAGDLRYTIPLNPRSGSRVELAARHESKDLSYQEVELDEGGETRISTDLISAYWHLPDALWREFELKTRVGLSLVGEDYDVFEVLFGNLPEDDQQVLIDILGPEAYQTLAPDFESVTPNLRLELRRRDDPLFITRGDAYRLDLLGTDEALGSNISFWQARLASWNIFPLGEERRLLLRTSWGYSDAESSEVLGVNFNQMPEIFEFRTGGARSVRGYQFEELFAGNTITGSRHLALASLEYEQQIAADWSAAVFVDSGNAFNDWDAIEPRTGAGFGLRWRSPVGVARIDLAFPLDDADNALQIYITVGPEF